MTPSMIERNTAWITLPVFTSVSFGITAKSSTNPLDYHSNLNCLSSLPSETVMRARSADSMRSSWIPTGAMRPSYCLEAPLIVDFGQRCFQTMHPHEKWRFCPSVMIEWSLRSLRNLCGLTGRDSASISWRSDSGMGGRSSSIDISQRAVSILATADGRRFFVLVYQDLQNTIFDRQYHGKRMTN
jgi:hypothetical protein